VSVVEPDGTVTKINEPGGSLSTEDLDRILDALRYEGAIILQPEHNRGDARRIFEWWPWERYPEARLIPQTHKTIGLH